MLGKALRITRKLLENGQMGRKRRIESHHLKRSKHTAGQMLKIGWSTLRHNEDRQRCQGLWPQLMCCALLYKHTLVCQRGRAERQGGQSRDLS